MSSDSSTRSKLNPDSTRTLNLNPTPPVRTCVRDALHGYELQRIEAREIEPSQESRVSVGQLGAAELGVADVEEDDDLH